jgi:hypothetical protein
VDATFDLVANGVLTPVKSATSLPQVPATLLKAIGWVESGWRQFAADGRPLVSPDFGYGVMQVTSGMPGAFGNVAGSIAPATASKIASEFRFNIAYGRYILQQKWETTPRIGDGDPSVLENWYFAIWAYNGWGWVNNPNNPRFSRSGTPATDPIAFPYQERVLYLVAHPPRDSQGNPLWPAIPVTMPSRRTIGMSPHSFQPRKEHRERPGAVAAVYQPTALVPASPGTTQQTRVQLTNTGTQPWIASGPNAPVLTYHVFARDANPWQAISPFTPGVIEFGQHPIGLPHDVLPGQKVILSVPVLAPAKPGTYRIVWDLEQGASAWLSQVGNLPRSEFLRVGATTSTPETSTPTPTTIPLEGLRYVRDTSFPDGSTVAPHQTLTKGWLVFNNGQAEWTTGWALHRVSGKAMGAATIPVPPTSPCHSANIVGTLKAPAKPGQYKSVWQLVDPAGAAVGERLTVVITVTRGPPPPTPTPSPSPTPGNLHPTPTPTPAG